MLLIQGIQGGGCETRRLYFSDPISTVSTEQFELTLLTTT